MRQISLQDSLTNLLGAIREMLGLRDRTSSDLVAY